MFSKFIPDIYSKSVYKINYEKLRNSGIRCLVFDLDNTITPVTLNKPTKRLKDLFTKLKSMGFKCIILSNSKKKRIEAFKNELAVDSGYSARKPSNKKYIKIMNNYNYVPDEIACVGDQLITDVYGANKMGFTSILVNPIGKKDLVVSTFNRFMEKIIFRSFRKRDLFIRGKYYD